MSAEAAGGPIRAKIAGGKPLFNAWLSLGSALAVELAAEAGADLVTIDRQHGLGGDNEMVAALTAAGAARIPALVRVVANDFGLIGRALDAGAHGVICPMVNSAEDAWRLVEAVKFPPLGVRSVGPFRARLALPDYLGAANDWTIACAQIETKAGLDNLDKILATPGLDMICAGPNDLALTLSGGADSDIRSPAAMAALDHILAKCREYSVIATVYANDPDYAKAMIAQGWQMVAVGSDARWLVEGARAARALFDRRA
jgi:4-hydroxy-2-oxoheptanedioate aldolase